MLKPPPPSNRRPRQRGVMLLEVLIAILIFALGVLGLVALQTNAVQQSSQSKYRADATLLANDLIGQMWITNRSYATLSTDFKSDGSGTKYNDWKPRVLAALPGSGTCAPTVALQQIAPLNAIVAGASAPAAAGMTPSTRVTVTMFWLAPSEGTDTTCGSKWHKFVLINEIK